MGGQAAISQCMYDGLDRYPLYFILVLYSTLPNKPQCARSVFRALSHVLHDVYVFERQSMSAGPPVGQHMK